MKKLLLLLVFLLVVCKAQAQIVNIPDANFKNALLNYNPPIDTNNDGEIQVSEAEVVLSLSVDYKGISSLEGIQSFVNIELLNCEGNSLTNLNLSQNLALRLLFCRDNDLTQLDVTQNTALLELNCSRNSLIQLDVTQNTALLELNCSRNPLINLDVSHNINLTELDCFLNGLTSLDISQNLDLERLQVYGNELTTLDVTQHINLLRVSCWQNKITSLDLSQNIYLEHFLCHDNQLTYLNINNGNNSNMPSMRAYGNVNLFCIQVDDVDYAINAPSWFKDPFAEYSKLCELNIKDIYKIGITLYPNPAQDILNIKTQELIKVIKIYSLQGSLVQEGSSASIDVSKLNAGLFFVQITFEGKTVAKKFIKE
jgi:type IX secretion system substrate protein